jgi:hypothetical protein
MDRYKNGKIYKIIDNTTGNIYIGSTCEPTLAHRLAKHKNSYIKYLKGKYHFVTSFKILENNDYDIILLEEYSCETKDQLLARERYYIENNNCVNKIIPTRNMKEYYKNNKDKIKEQQKEYYENNKDKKLEYQKQYKELNIEKIKQRNYEQFICECGGKYTYNHKVRHLNTIKHEQYLETLNK